MKKVKLSIFFMLLTGACIIGQTYSKNVREFVTKMYIHGLPYEEAKLYGKPAVPELLKMLKDPSLEPYHANIVSALGYIGDPLASNDLVYYVEASKGEISLDRFNAILLVFQALGHIAQSGDSGAMKTLKDYTSSESWKSKKLNFSFKQYKTSVLSEVLVRQAIVGLGITGKTEAQQKLDELRRSSTTPRDLKDNLNEAMNLNEKIQKLGAKKVFTKRY